ncbi:PAS-domain containing protein [Marivivens sp. JLT3646]|uniref:PAS-domain containing protein n=1 Tax=Marivivens sp. JLT3646 TaxID=1920883 RepID=UPI0007FEE183|nr:PAS-domain containing protein [Marivivens sp. JLT3646]APO87989.1 hybrid sensor histidine kinase/response regulator [Marivivens sp. JLT3646]OBR35088.1 hybrid sensor histidine kinase/response regulator [Donghicola sp. JL3646]
MTPNSLTLIDLSEPIERQRDKLLKICDALMQRVEQNHDDRSAAYTQFQRAVLLEEQVRERTRDLEHALDLLNESNARLATANLETERARSDLANAIETIQEGFGLFDSDGTLIMCNSRFGMHMPDIRSQLRPGLSFNDYVGMVSRSRYLHLPDGSSAEAWVAQRMQRHGEEHVMFNVRMIWDRWVQVSEHRMAGGQTVVMQTDISDIIRMERMERGRLMDDQAKLIRATLEHINQGVGIFDHNQRLVGFNQRLAHLMSIPLTQIRIGLDFEIILRLIENDITIEGEVTGGGLMRWVTRTDPRPPLRFEFKRGETRWFDLFAEEMPDKGFVISITDITAEKDAARALSLANESLEQRVTERTLELEDALAVAERAIASRSRFVAAASHDLLQPLSAATLYLSSIGEELTDPRHSEVVSKAQNALTSVQDIIEALLDISKLESGRAAVDIHQIDLGALLRQLRDEFEPIAAKKGLRLKVLPSDLRVKSDATYIRRILQNLISNAVRYTNEGTVLVGTRRTRRSVRVEVWDTGPGIPASEHETIFKEFHRLNARSSASEGLGLGLAIVDRACALLRHPLTVESTEGKGTAFKVTVPLADDTTHIPPSRLSVPAQTTWRHDGLVVLLVENDLDMRRALTLLLEKWNVEVLDVSSGEEAARLITEIDLAPDAMLIDFQLDNGELGTEVIKRLRSLIGRVPTRLITANRNIDVHALSANIGVEVLNKPIDPISLHLFLETAGSRN